QRLWAERVVRSLNAVFPDMTKFENWSLLEMYLPHVKLAAQLIDEWGFEFREAGLLINRTGYYLDDGAQYSAALPIYQRALAIFEKALGSDHPSVATGLNNLAELYRNQGNYEAALRLQQRALAIREKALGPSYPGVANSRASLGQTVTNLPQPDSVIGV